MWCGSSRARGTCGCARERRASLLSFPAVPWESDEQRSKAHIGCHFQCCRCGYQLLALPVSSAESRLGVSVKASRHSLQCGTPETRAVRRDRQLQSSATTRQRTPRDTRELPTHSCPLADTTAIERRAGPPPPQARSCAVRPVGLSDIKHPINL